MKKIYKEFLCLLCVGALFSCAKEVDLSDETPVENPEEEVIPEGYSKVTFTASSEEVETRTALSGANTVWSEGDQIKVFYSDADPAVLTIDPNDAGNSTGKFIGIAPNGKTPTYAVYPASVTASVSGSTVNVTVPAQQPGTFAAGNIAVAKVGSDHNMSFKNVNAFLVFQLKEGSAVSKVVATSVDGGALAGEVPVICSGAAPAPGVPSSTSSEVSMITSGAGTYYMSVVQPSANHTKGLKLTYYTGSEGNYMESGVYYFNKNLPIAANKIYTIGEVVTDRNYYVTVSGGGKHNGLDWTNAFSAAEMWKRLTLTAKQAADPNENPEADPESKEAKIAAINGATFHIGAGSYNFATSTAPIPTINLNPGASEPIVLTFKGGYPAAGGTQDLTQYRADFSGDNAHPALTLRGVLDVAFEGIGFVNGLVNSEEVGALDINASDAADDISVSMSYCYVGNNYNASYSDATHANTNKGAGLCVKNATSFSADHVTFENNYSYAASGAVIRDCEALFTNCTFSDNVAYQKAGAIFVSGTSNSSVSASFTSCTFDSNKTESYNGGAFYQGKGASTFTNCTFTDNEAFNDSATSHSGNDGYGGAIYSDNGSVTVSGGTFTGNKAYRGGCLCLNGTPNTISGATFSGNGGSTTRNGAVIYVKNATTFENCTFDGNEALYAAAFALYGGSLTINGGIIRNHHSDYGGAIEVENATLTIGRYNNVGTQITNNYSTSGDGQGGFLAISPTNNNTATVNITGAVFKGNHVTVDGGAIYAAGPGTPNLTLTECTFGGTASGDPNYSGRDGGALSISKGSTTITDCTFTNNWAYIDTWDRGESDATAAGPANIGYGGAIDCFSSASLSISGGTFSGNKAWRGGAMNLNGSGTMTLTSVTFNGNGTLAETRGGGVAYVKKEVTFDNCILDGNLAHWGGAIMLVNGGVANINGGIIRYNESGDGAGAIEVDNNGILVVNKYNNTTATQFIGNHTPTNGGAIFFETNNTSKVNYVNDAVFKGNYAVAGGAILATEASTTVQINRCTFGGTGEGEPNYCMTHTDAIGSFGGAISVASAKYVTVSGSSFIGNNSEQRGGAVFSQQDLTLTDCTFTGNHSSWGGAIASRTKTVTVNGGSFNQNYARGGGAVLVDSNGSFVIDRNGSTGTLFYQNYADNGTDESWGGAIRIESKNADFACTGATFRQNHIDYSGTKACYGGAVSITSVQNGVHANIVECVFDGNYSACNGGSALSYQSGTNSDYGDGSGYMRVIDTRFEGNHTDYASSMGLPNEVGRHGGAVRLGHDATPSYFDGCTFIGNYTETPNANRISAYGGAITYYADEMCYLNNCYFEGNRAARGGAISGLNCGVSGIYLNACSFSGNYNSWGGGSSIVLCGVKKLGMNNCSFNDNTYVSNWNNTREDGSWVYVSGSYKYGAGVNNTQTDNVVTEELVISNCTVIGTNRGPSAAEITASGRELFYVIEMASGKKMQMINNCMINSGSTSHDAWWTNAVDLYGYYNVFRTAGRTNGSYTDTASTGKYSGSGTEITKSDLLPSGIAWNSTTHVWPWNGSLANGKSYTKITATNFDSYMSSASADFYAWLQNVDPKGPATKNMLHTDQLGNNRGSGSWRPGAYQN